MKTEYIKQKELDKRWFLIDADNKNAFLLKLDKATKNYSNFINSYIAADGSNLGYEKIINTLKSRFF